MTTMNLTNTRQTKRKPNKKKNLSKLWGAFDNEEMDKTKKLELHYTNSDVRTREFCDLCKSAVAYQENKLLTCTNPQCGIIYKDVLDQAAEWRYYGAEDSSMVDPTRCGMPINPLLKESYFTSSSAFNTSSRILRFAPLLIAMTSPLTGDVNFTRSLYLS